MLLCLGLWVGCAPAQAGSEIIARSGGYRLTEQDIQHGIMFAEVQAGVDFSDDDADSLREDFIAWFNSDPATAAESFAGVTNNYLRNRTKFSQTDLAIMRYNYWAVLAKKSETFHDFKTEPWSRLILQLNPVLVRSHGMIITQRDVDWLFNSQDFIAQIAGVEPPSQEDRDRYARRLASRFSSMSDQERENLRRSQSRLAAVHMCMDGTVRTKAAMVAYIRDNVQSTDDLARVARQIEDDSQYQAKYNVASKTEKLNAIGRTIQITRETSAINDAVRRSLSNSQVPQRAYPGGSPY